MKWLRRYNESTTIKATDETIRKIVFDEIWKFGFKCDLNHIDVHNVTKMDSLFGGSRFNGDISEWNVHNVSNMSSMFSYSFFNGYISEWNVGNVTDMKEMFYFSLFNGDISGWNVENVRDMSLMFRHSQFNGHISNWNVRNVTNMSCMFYDSKLKGREPWWYTLSPIFNRDNYSMFDSLDFGWIDIEEKIIYGDKLSKILLRTYNKNWNGKLPRVFGFTYQ